MILSRNYFCSIIKQIKNWIIVKGFKYIDISFENDYIIGMRESTKKSFKINAYKLQDAYIHEETINTRTLKAYVDRVQSPSLAILLQIGVVKTQNG